MSRPIWFTSFQVLGNYARLSVAPLLIAWAHLLIYPGHTAGSHFLEAVLETVPDGFYEALLIRGFLGQESGGRSTAVNPESDDAKHGTVYPATLLFEYAEHSVANFVVQALLQHVRTRDQFTRLACILIPFLPKLLRMVLKQATN